MAEFLKNDGSGVFSGVLVLGFFLSVAILAVITTISVYWMHTRREELRANLVRELIDRGVPLDQVERLAGGPDPSASVREKKLEGDLASIMVQNEIPGPAIERVLRIYQQADPTTKKAVYSSLEEIVGSGPTDEQLLAAVTALCPARSENPPTSRFEQSAASA